MAWNLSTGSVVGLLVGGAGYVLTGRSHMAVASVEERDGPGPSSS
jgi:hypothetical protein